MTSRGVSARKVWVGWLVTFYEEDLVDGRTWWVPPMPISWIDRIVVWWMLR